MNIIGGGRRVKNAVGVKFANIIVKGGRVRFVRQIATISVNFAIT